MTTLATASSDVTFLRKVFRILSHENALVVAWDVCGTQFTVKSTTTMNTSILPHYFRSTGDMTYATFRKHLVAHGFSMAHQSHDSESFRHAEYTRSSATALASTMKRRRLVQPKHSSSGNVPSCHLHQQQPTRHNQRADNPSNNNDNLWQLLSVVCTMQTNPLFELPAIRSDPCTFAVDGWADLTTPAVVCL
ncbi:hypothetical protein H257_03989 [Aphanomyces astaci]|uniref:HSF-type DNA-binding domain-containing protein n=1 Tax=Aphanomyces astaci TaxID=112090 RepID=W4GU46_APHAT|nr:hypothetical protein H257_03989 [Aphanomyces astaci]ETV83202.1 hypothetical protein H257_03989 [Aphanomyces astaci]RHY13315.1 hypothetical protein DYB25_002764 [Aphanomyces astaci]RHY16231.1 hypothetical protein DYB36_006512 [Aphanomyces astaci]RHY44032.1 hypothetical protein DYB34_004171 [Aphanomyces astaci]RHY58660.1 hypothetical protein DYB30_003715 [Aphanomyces astaci]|eukprot:XP_009826632.1 hypothetical protein H257_03989 [Aphanomyces astaci]